MQLLLTLVLAVITICRAQNGYYFSWRNRPRDTCDLPADSGHSCGVDPGPRYGYDKNAQKCVFFEFLGCAGNSNQYKNKKTCEAACQLPRESRPGYWFIYGVEPTVDGITQDEGCNMPIDQGHNCNEDKVPRFAFDRTQEKCVFFEYDGCGGNANRFKSRQECAAVCIPQ